MTPQELASEIRKIAAKIDASKNPSRKLVAADIKRVINRLATEEHDVTAGGIMHHGECNMSVGGKTYHGKTAEECYASYKKDHGDCSMTVGGKMYHGKTAEECYASYKDACARGEH
jgi:hypothetical protein